VEIEFSANLMPRGKGSDEFFFLQMRPMVANVEHFAVEILPRDRERAFCRSNQALGNGFCDRIADILFVKPADFKPEATLQMAAEIGRINTGLAAAKRPYLLVGPGRWGTSDRWLGIPVQWRQIHGVGAIVELRNRQLKVDPSQGSHFFQNITSLGIPYLTVSEGEGDLFDWPWVEGLPVVQETAFLRHVRLAAPMTLKIDGRRSAGVIVRPEGG
jgi:hypothetical protein